MILNAQIYKTNNIVNLAIIDIGTTMYKFLPSGVFTIEPYSRPLVGLILSIKDNINIAQYKTSYGSPSWQVNIRLPFIRHCCKNVEVIGVLRRNPRFFRPFKLSTVEQLDPVRPQLTNRGNMPVQSLPGYPKFLA
ncbi:hypothetical protein F4W66_22780 (plasmid) [Escherichia coli]|nr:hypothetical protein F4W66_22780 [Escherichia coli]